jgi:hypothetical protein
VSRAEALILTRLVYAAALPRWGRPLTCRPPLAAGHSKPREPRAPRAPREPKAPRAPREEIDTAVSVWVANLPAVIEGVHIADELKAYFGTIGAVTTIRVIGKGAIVAFANAASAGSALALNGADLRGSLLLVEPRRVRYDSGPSRPSVP